MHVEEIRAGQLSEFVQSETFARFDILPITVLRALSQAVNPRASINDVVLIVAYDENYRVIGYVGALPDVLSNGQKIVWNSCWYTDPILGRTMALPLFMQFIRHWQGKIVMQDLTPHTRKIIETLPYFTFIRKIPGQRIFLRSYSSELMTDHFPSEKWMKPVFQLVDAILNGFQSLRMSLWKKKNLTAQNVRIQIVSEIDEETGQFISSHNDKELFRRGGDELQWIMKHPWISEENSATRESGRSYYFSSVAGSFSVKGLKYFVNDELYGFVLIKERNGHYELPYAYAGDNQKNFMIIEIKRYLIDKKAFSFLLFNQNFRDIFYGHNKLPVLHSKKVQREMVVSSELIGNINENAEVQDGDGDCAFT